MNGFRTWPRSESRAGCRIDEAGPRPPPIASLADRVFAPPTHPRYNAFDWETWHELDVLRRELAPRFEAKEP
jgi:hypothetical protein